MTETHFKTIQRWFQSLNQKVDRIENTMATKDDLDKLFGVVQQVHRRIDDHLADDDQEKRVYRLAIERLEQKVTTLQERI